MIYLVQSYYNDKQNHPRKCLKIGYAKNIEERMKAYKTYNPSIQLLKTREGEYDLESFLHRYFDKYKLPDFNEWFIYKKEIIDKFDILDSLDETITREEYLEYIRKEIITNIIPEIYKDLRLQIPDLLDELKQEFDNDYNLYSSLYTEFPERECENIIIKTLKFLRETENNYFTDCDFSTDILDKFSKEIPRQRLKENVFRDECIFIYKLSDKELTEDSFETLRDRKLQITNEHIKNFEAIRISNPEGIKEYLDLIRLESKTNRYTKSYTGVNEKSGTVVINKLVMLSERRAFELRSNVYKSEVNIYNEFGLIPSLSINSSPILNEILELEKIYKEKGSFEFKMRFICEFLIKNIGIVSYQDLKFLKREHLNYLYLLGPEKIKALGYFEANIKREIKINDSESLILEAFKEVFIIGGRYTLKYIKNRISEIYKELGLTKTSKASDIEEFFEVKRCTIIDSGKRVNGYEILSLK